MMQAPLQQPLLRLQWQLPAAPLLAPPRRAALLPRARPQVRKAKGRSLLILSYSC
jgi:hypothetical protein